MAKFKNFILSLLTFTAIIFLLVNPKAVSLGAIKGLTICGEIIIPSLFIFSVIGIFIVSSNCTAVLSNILSPFSRLIFGLNGNTFIVFLISLIAGYPVGAKLIDNMVKERKITESNANKMLCYCVNAGPAFIILAIGEKIFSSKTLGIILFVSHILSSIILAIILRSRPPKTITEKAKNKPLSDAFVNSVSDAAQSMLSICAFVVLFSVVFEVLTKYNFQFFSPFLEVTVGIISTKNLFFASFLLGFSGISVQLQILSQIKNFKVNKIRFLIFRIFHGALSTIITFIIIKLLKISVATLSNNLSFSLSFSSLNLSASICFLFTGIVFIASLKKPRFN